MLAISNLKQPTIYKLFDWRQFNRIYKLLFYFGFMPIYIDRNKCRWQKEKNCTGCAEVCPMAAITRTDKVVIDYSKCTECGACVGSCKNKALSFE